MLKRNIEKFRLTITSAVAKEIACSGKCFYCTRDSCSNLYILFVGGSDILVYKSIRINMQRYKFVGKLENHTPITSSIHFSLKSMSHENHLSCPIDIDIDMDYTNTNTFPVIT